MKLKNNLIIDAIDALEKSGIVKDNQYESEYKGYISSFGAAIIQSGLLPAVIFYENSSRGKSEKKALIDAIVRILKKQNSIYERLESTELSEGEKRLDGKQKAALLKERLFSQFIIKNETQKEQIKRDVNAAAVALKLAIRTFESTNQQKKENE